MSIILASQSPRRRELLAQMGVPQFEVVPALGEEIASPGLSPAQLVEVLSRQKAEEVAVQAGPDDVVIAADTVVAVDGAVLGKPRDPADAARMLSAALRPGPHRSTPGSRSGGGPSAAPPTRLPRSASAR